MRAWIKAAIAGAGAGILSGLIGTGGGMVLVPLLRDWAGVDAKKAMATTVLCIAPLCIMSAALYGARGALDWGAAWPYLVGGLAGGIPAGMWLKSMPPVWLRRGFGALLLIGGVVMLL